MGWLPPHPYELFPLTIVSRSFGAGSSCRGGCGTAVVALPSPTRLLSLSFVYAVRGGE